MILSIIVAIAENNVIGKDNRLIWHLPADLQYFKKLTMGRAIIMGRKTFESIGKPLPGRTSIIITRNKSFIAEGCVICNSLDEAIAHVSGHEEAFIIGGAQIYKEAMPLADKLYITRVHTSPEGDVFFSEPDENQWELESKTDMQADEKNIFPYTFLVYKRK